MQNCNIRMGKDIWIKSNHLWRVHIYSNPFMLFLCSYIIEALSLSYFLLTSDRSTQIIFAKFHSFKSTIYNIKTHVTNIPSNMGYIFAFFRPYYIKSWHVNMARGRISDIIFTSVQKFICLEFGHFKAFWKVSLAFMLGTSIFYYKAKHWKGRPKSFAIFYIKLIIF